MAFSSISNSKLHCCLVILILFILVFLSLPLMLIYLANTRFEETWQSPNTTLVKNITCPKSERVDDGSPVQCPDGLFPCPSCPDICIHQHRMCDGINDCPDRWDESVSICYDSNGLIGTFFKRILDTRDKGQAEAAVLAKPDSCDYEMFIQEQCNCNMSEPNVIICEGLGLRSIPSDLSASVFKIRMSNNSIDSLHGIKWPRSLTSLVLEHNEIAQIHRGAFKSAPSLSKLYLGHNNISEIDDDAFESAASLTSLQMELNQLTSFNTRILRHTPALAMLHLSENQIDLPEETRFNISPDLKELLLDHNQISLIKRTYFSKMPRLMWLSLTHNQISYIETDSFDGNYDLQELNLSFNRLTVIDRRIFAHRLNIQRLYLSGNPISPGGLPVDAFRDVMELKSLNLTQIEFADLKRETFAYLRHLEFIYFEKFRYCHYAAQVRVCRPITDGLSSIEELLAFPILKYAVWIVALVCSLGNVFVFIWRSVSPHEDRTLSLFIKNLSIADLMMGVYLSTIGWQDWKFQSNFRNNAIEWMSSWKCSAIGFLAILSSELSVFILTIITIERYRSIMSTHRLEEAAQKQRARLYVALAWLFSFLIAFYPLFQWLNRKSDFYATNGLCLPLHIDQPFTAGWQYSAFIYLGVNFLAVLVIIALYAHMYTMIIDGRQNARPVLFKAEKREDAILAIRFFFIVVTDCMCWIPIVVIKIMALLRVSISASIYGWLVVFIIPINSALNPIVYTLAAPTTLRAAVCRIFERLCYSIDRLNRATGACHGAIHSHSVSQASSDIEPNVLIGRRRRKMGSNSTTTCDTFDTSITSNSKVSFDSALLPASHQAAAAAAMMPSDLIADYDAHRQLFSFNEQDKRRSGRPGGFNGGGGSKESSFSSTASSSPLRTAAELTKRLDEQKGERVLSSTNKFDCITSYKRNTVRHRVLQESEEEILHKLDPWTGLNWTTSSGGGGGEGRKSDGLSLARRIESIKIGFRSGRQSKGSGAIDRPLYEPVNPDLNYLDEGGNTLTPVLPDDPTQPVLNYPCSSAHQKTTGSSQTPSEVETGNMYDDNECLRYSLEDDHEDTPQIDCGRKSSSKSHRISQPADCELGCSARSSIVHFEKDE